MIFFKNKYNKGFYSNLQEVFGKNPLIWLIPITLKNSDKGGYDFNISKINKKLKDEIKSTINQLKEKTFSLDLEPNSIEKNAKNDW